MTDATDLRAGLFQRFFGRLRFPQLFTLAAILFVVDLLIPDLIPFADEILLGMLTTLFASMKSRAPEPGGAGVEPVAKPPEKDVTPRA
jgi:hypothetical protein